MTSHAPRAAGALLVLAAGLAIAPIALAADQASPAATQMGPSEQESRPSDEESLAMVHVINQHEIDSGKLALTRPAGEPTLALAKMLVQEHTQNDAMQAKLGVAPRQTPAVMSLQRQKKAEADKLAALPPDAFERAYIDAMVKGHTEAKQMLDKRAATASSPQVRTYLVQTRTAVENHLSKARTLQAAAVGK